MDNQAVINEINLLKAHAHEALKIADRLTTALSPDQDSAKNRKKRQMEDQVARFLARKNKKVNEYQIR